MVKGLAGLVVWGAIRDTPEIARLGFAAFSSKVCANAGEPKGFGEIGVSIMVAGQTVRPGDWVVGDDDGVVVVPQTIAEDVLVEAERKAATESEIRVAVRDGMQPLEAYERYGTF
jgi:3-hexulose-6-phosphate synthase/6-phospho-3-hexuloisomerase